MELTDAYEMVQRATDAVNARHRKVNRIYTVDLHRKFWNMHGAILHWSPEGKATGHSIIAPATRALEAS